MMVGERVGMPDAHGISHEIPEYDRDSIHTLPLSVVPLRTVALRRARLVKNVRLDTRIELFRERGMGSGQIAVEEVPDFFDDEGGLKDDMLLMRRLCQLPAFDPYTLRIGLRQAGIDLLDVDVLQLSPAKKKQLAPLMRNITLPLVRHLYGDDGGDENDLDTLVRRVAKPDTPKVRKKIGTMAKGLGIPISALPDMLEDYGDTYLALSYYRSYFQYCLPIVDRMVFWMIDVRDSGALRRDLGVRQAIDKVEEMLNFISRSVTKRFNGFDQNTMVQWDQVTLQTFNAVRDAITKHQKSLAEVLCGLTVKVYEWGDKFPSGGGSPEKRAEFVVTEIKPGLDRLWALERRSPKFSN
jgi:hypothetical protein